MQRADSALRLNVHFHTLALDGVYVRDEEGELQFRELGEPTTEDVAQSAHTMELTRGLSDVATLRDDRRPR